MLTWMSSMFELLQSVKKVSPILVLLIPGSFKNSGGPVWFARAFDKPVFFASNQKSGRKFI
jgi:hypothetical protein